VAGVINREHPVFATSTTESVRRNFVLVAYWFPVAMLLRLRV
jgi:hypothetical protein